MNDIHIGKKIKEVFLQSSMSIQDFADFIHRTRTTIYDIFNRKSIDIELLISISEALNYDFIGYVHDEFNFKESKKNKLYIIKEISSDQLDNVLENNRDVILAQEIHDRDTVLNIK